MKLFIPYSKIGYPRLISVALQYDLNNPVLYHCTEEDSYYNLLNKLWHEGETFIIVEHDIIPWPGAVTELNNCPEPWCTFPYNLQTNGSLGCTKFGSKILKEFSNALDEPFFQYYTKTWAMLDGYVWDKLTSLGIERHIHKPNVAHLHAHQSAIDGITEGR